jgi:hypothetical protein
VLAHDEEHGGKSRGLEHFHSKHKETPHNRLLPAFVFHNQVLLLVLVDGVLLIGEGLDRAHVADGLLSDRT